MDKLFRAKSSDRSRPTAVIEWPDGLNGPPIVYPASGSDEVDETIRKLLAAAIWPARVGKDGS